ncbi:MAG: iron-sulfur cluster-binding protein [Bacteroidetes bacterium 4484_249]|nr:MAG: iron-sulfur cluster-binding protein [Bacteroidetes bacterium 4484_249]
MHDIHHKFLKDSESKAFNLEHRNKINFNISKYDISVAKGKLQYKDLELAKKRAASIKHKVINNLDKYLIEFATNFENRGGKIIWAVDTEEAISEILKVLKKYDAKHVVKSKSMITEEIELNEALEKNNIESLETDLGEYIVQIAGEKPYHIVTPAMHKSKDDVAKLFNEKFNTPRESTPKEIASFVRNKLREKFINADIGITGGNFLIADTGAVCLTENEGNGLMCVSFPKIHIAVVGIEKIIPSITDLGLFWPLLSSHGTGQNITVYNSIITGPRQEGEADGPDEMYLVLLENNRSKILKHEEQRLALTCIRCGACLNACPVYKNIGGHAYATTYSGPIGSVITPYLKGMKEYNHLSFASSLCGKCTEVCPVKIPLHELLLNNRNESVKEGYSKSIDKIGMFGMNKTLSKRKRMDFFSPGMKNFALQIFFKKMWGSRRELPKVAKKSFHDMWMEKKGN